MAAAGVVAAVGMVAVGAGASDLLFHRFFIGRRPITTRLLYIIRHRHTTRQALRTDIPPTAPADQHSTSNLMASRVTAV